MRRPTGGPLLGWLADVAGPRVPIVVGAVTCVAGAAWAERMVRRRGGRGVDDETPAVPVAG